jgi:uncharacterized integral membrane protein (TIGR00698 family)
LLQVCVGLLGLGMDLQKVLEAGRQGLVMAAVTIVATFIVGMGLGRLLGVDRITSALLSSGTAICGGSAIAAVGTATGATRSQMSVSLGAVFILNAVALYLFPPIGHALGLTEAQFGAWDGVAIHDGSSVVGATSAYGPTALQVGTAVKLSRALWIAPVTLAVSWALGDRSKATFTFPWFVLGFLAASVASTTIPAVRAASPPLVELARAGFAAALFLVGTDLSPATLREVGWRVLLQAAASWAVISGLALWAISS